MKDEVINFKKALEVKNQKKIEKLKNIYFTTYLTIESMNIEQIDEIFLEDNQEEIDSLSKKSTEYILQLMTEWKKEYVNFFKNRNAELIKEIEQEIDEQINMGYDSNTILLILMVKFSKKLPSNITKKAFLKDILNDYYDRFINRNWYKTIIF